MESRLTVPIGSLELVTPASLSADASFDLTSPGFRIERELARGGMGRVFVARDLSLGREVAIKILLPGRERERFLEEARITALLPHPNIPPVYAVGELRDGTPWLAMKLIHGETLADLLDSGQLCSDRLPRMLNIFEQVAQAVGFAHSRRIIHRDLKPSNVMVGQFGEVQVMDWGLAKELDHERIAPQGEHYPDAVDQTLAGTVMGTPGYMAPEQARGESVDTRADVFALGSILAHILTGQPAFTGKTSEETITRSAHADLSEAIRRLDSCGADAELIGLAKRCLAPLPVARPHDAQAVAAEVAAYRLGVEARLRQAETDRARAETREAERAKRHRILVWSGGLLTLVLLAGLLVTRWQMNRAVIAESKARQSEQLALQERDAKELALQAETKALADKTSALQAEREAKALAEQRRLQAEANLAFARKGNEILGAVFRNLDPSANYATVAEFRNALKQNLLNAVRELDDTSIGDPVDVAEMLNTLGVSLMSMGEASSALAVFGKAQKTLESHLGQEHPKTLNVLNNLASAYQSSGQFQKALPLYETVLERRKARLGIEHDDTLTSMNNLASAFRQAGLFHRALPLYEETYKLRSAMLGADHPNTLTSLNNLAVACRDVGNVNKALSLYEESVQRHTKRFGPDHPETLNAMNNLATGYYETGQPQKAVSVLENILKISKERMGPDHPETLATMNNLAMAYHAVQQTSKCLALFEETLSGRKARLGPDHPDTLMSMNNFATILQLSGQADRAIPLLLDVARLRSAKLGDDHPDTLVTLNNLSTAYRAIGQLDKAIPILENVLARRTTTLGPQHPETLGTLNNLAIMYRDSGRLDQALALLEEAATRIGKQQTNHPYSWQVLANVVNFHEAANRLDRAEHWRKQRLAIVRDRGEGQSLVYAAELVGLGLNLLRQQKWTEAEQCFREGLDIREKKAPDEWTTFNTMCLLGAALLGQEKYVEAEALSVIGYEGLLARQSLVPSGHQIRIREALDLLISIYSSMGKTEEAQKYRRKREEFQGVSPPNPQ
ncbi:MAG: tetratricopeptide repeat protein [Gemmataceae bacterium]|nr:tetratricopeptide repeat protein [Gemmataceae bacterium]